MGQTANLKLTVLMHDELVTASKLIAVFQDVVKDKSSTQEQIRDAVNAALMASRAALFGCDVATHIVVLNPRVDHAPRQQDREIIVKNNKIVEERTANAAGGAK